MICFEVFYSILKLGIMTSESDFYDQVSCDLRGQIAKLEFGISFYDMYRFPTLNSDMQSNFFFHEKH